MGLPKEEKEILKFWEEENIFKKSLAQNKDKENFVFYDGPITVNAKPGIHHVLARVFKDVIPRFKTMQGYYVERKNGWDTHGLPVELEVEKNLDFDTKKEIKQYGIKKFNKKCKQNVKKYLPVFKKLTKRIGYWVDMEEGYTTFKSDYIETLWWILKQVWEQDLLYQDRKVVPYCPRCGTSLSSHEVAQGYEEVTEPAVYIKFQVTPNQSQGHSMGQRKLQIPKNTYLLAWTTTPWTLPGNVALAVSKNLNYALIKEENSGEKLILAEKRLEVLDGEYEIIKKFKGKKLLETEYEPLFKISSIKEDDNFKNAYKVYAADFVEAEEGTGIVHTACMYGEEDYKLGKKESLPFVHTVNKEGKFKERLGASEILNKIEGKFVKEADPVITEKLAQKNSLYKKEAYSHEYPFCWRCDTPLLYYAKTSWFIKMTELKDKLLENNQNVNWTPEHLKEGRFGEWLKDVKDWALSRDRFWGTPLPIWKCSQCGKEICVGSVQELKQKSTNFDQVFGNLQQEELPDLHRPQIDEIKLKCENCGSKMERVPYVADVWFDSGSMPFAQQHYPFENKEAIEKNKLFPADYISEAIDQTRGWFYTLLAVSTLLRKGNPYENVLCLGLVFDENGEEMSKSKGNIVQPFDQIEKYGADPIRWFFYVINSPDKEKKYDEKELKNHRQRLFYTLGNSLRFLKMYSPETVSPTRFPDQTDNILDQWLISRTHKITREITDYLEDYKITKAARKLEDFVDELSNWYIRSSRDRFQNPDSEKELRQSSQTLAAALYRAILLLAPFCPFYSENKFKEIKQFFSQSELSQSVHLSDWPTSSEKKIDEKLEQNMERAKKIVSLALQKRREAEIKVRQPLSSLKVKGIELPQPLTKLLKKELNVKKINYEQGKKLKIKLNQKITPSLKKEGGMREFIRTIQSLRKEAGLTPEDGIKVFVQNKKFSQTVVEEWGKQIKKKTRAEEVETAPAKKIKKLQHQKEAKTREGKIAIGIKK